MEDEVRSIHLTTFCNVMPMIVSDAGACTMASQLLYKDRPDALAS